MASYKSFINGDNSWEEERKKMREEASKRQASEETERQAYNAKIRRENELKPPSPSTPSLSQNKQPLKVGSLFKQATSAFNKINDYNNNSFQAPQVSLNTNTNNDPSYSIASKFAQGALSNYRNPQAIKNEPSWGSVIGNSVKSGLVGSVDGGLNMVRTGTKYVDNYMDNKDGFLINWLNNTHKYLDDKVQGYEQNLQGISPYSNKDFLSQGIKGAVQVGTTLLPGGVVAKGAKGLGLGAKAITAARMVPFGVQAGGNYASDAEKAGATEGQQLAYGLVGGAAEIASESFFGLGPLVNKFGKAGAKEIINAGADTLVKKYGKLGLSYAKNILGETAQEVAIDPVMGLAEKGIYNKDKALVGKDGVIDTAQMGQDAFGGAAMSVLLSAIGLGSNTLSHRKASYLIENNIKPTEETIKDIQNTMVEELKTFQAPEVNPGGAIPGKGIQNQNAVNPSLNIQNNNQNDNFKNIDTSKINNTANAPTVNPNLDGMLNNYQVATKTNSIAQNQPVTSENMQSNINAPVTNNMAKNEVLDDSTKYDINNLANPFENDMDTFDAEQNNESVKPGDIKAGETFVSKDGKEYEIGEVSHKDNQVAIFNHTDGLQGIVSVSQARKLRGHKEEKVIKPRFSIGDNIKVGNYKVKLKSVNGNTAIVETETGDREIPVKDLNKKGSKIFQSTVINNTNKTEAVSKPGLKPSVMSENNQGNVTAPIENKQPVNAPKAETKVNTNLETPKTIEPGQKYKTNFGEVTVKENDGAMIKLVNKSGTEIPIGVKAFNNIKPKFLGSEAVAKEEAAINNNETIIDDNTPTEDLDNPIEMYKPENKNEIIEDRPSVEASVTNENKQGNTINPIETKASQNEELKEIEYKQNDEVLLNHDGKTDAGVVSKVNKDGTYEIQRPEGDYVLAKKNGDTFETIKSEPTPKDQIPLDERTNENVGNRKVKAYQYLHPELKHYIQNEANILQGELRETIPADAYMKPTYEGESSGVVEKYTRTKRVATQDIAYLKDTLKASYADIGKALDNIIKDNGSENNALSKKIELLIDHRLSNGYTDMMGNDIPGNDEYVAKKNEIEGIAKSVNAEVKENTIIQEYTEMYHGTKIYFEQYDASKSKTKHYNPMGEGMYVTPKKSLAKEFGDVFKVKIPKDANIKEFSDKEAKEFILNILDKSLKEFNFDMNDKLNKKEKEDLNKIIDEWIKTSPYEAMNHSVEFFTGNEDELGIFYDKDIDIEEDDFYESLMQNSTNYYKDNNYDIVMFGGKNPETIILNPEYQKLIPNETSKINETQQQIEKPQNELEKEIPKIEKELSDIEITKEDIKNIEAKGYAIVEGELEFKSNLYYDLVNIIGREKTNDFMESGYTIDKEASVKDVKTGEPITLELYHAKNANDVYNGIEYPILGKGKYYAITEEQAEQYGNDIEKEEITLNNPYVIKNDSDWNNLTLESDWPYYNPMYFNNKKEAPKLIDKLQQSLIDNGYDGVIVKVQDFNNKSLYEVFGHSQVVKYNKANNNQTVKETNKQLYEMTRKEFDNYYGIDKLYDRSNKESVESFNNDILNVLDKTSNDIGKIIAKEVGSTDLQTIADYYVKKYNTQNPIKIVYALPNRKNGPIGSISINSMAFLDKNNNTPVQIQFQKKFENNPSEIYKAIATFRHEFEHYLDLSEGYESVAKGKFKSEPGKQYSMKDIYNAWTKGHHKNYNWFEIDYLRKAIIEEALRDNKNVSNEVLKEYPEIMKRLGLIKEEDIKNKKIWERTLSEHLANSRYGTKEMNKKSHKIVVEKALKKGDLVPENVLEDYPDLKEQYKPKETKKDITSISKEEVSNGITLDKWLDTISKDDINYDKAYNAYRAISFEPDRRAESEQKGYVNAMNDIYEEMSKLAETPEQKTVLLNELNKYKENYLKHMNEILSAKSRTMSAMITGPARFPKAKNEKALQAEHNKVVAFLEWQKKAEKSIKKALEGSTTPEQATDKEFNRLKDEAMSTIATLKGIENGTDKGYSPTLFRNSLRDKLMRSLNNGNVETVSKVLDLIKETEKEHLKKPVFASNNGIWKAVETAKEKLKNEPETKTGTETIKKYDGSEIVKNFEADRVQLLFDEKPSEEIRAELKKSGWHFSPSNNVWQRKLTSNAEYAAKRIMDKHFKEVDKENNYNLSKGTESNNNLANKIVNDAKDKIGLSFLDETPTKNPTVIAKRVTEYVLNPNNTLKHDPIKDFVNNLHQNSKNTKVSPLHNAIEVILNKSKYKNEIESAYNLTKDKYKDNNIALKALDNYFKEITGKEFFTGYNPQVRKSKTKEKYRQTIVNSFINSPAIPQEIKDMLKEHPEYYVYIEHNNEEAMKEAREYVDNNYSEAISKIKDLEALRNDNDTAIALEIERRMIEEGDFEGAEQWSLRIAKLATGAGQAIQYFSTLQRMTPQWSLNHMQKQISKKVSEEDADKLEKVSKQVSEKLNEVNKGVVDKVLGKIKKLLHLDKLGLSFINENDSVEILAKKISSHVKNTKAKDDPILNMVNTLYKVAKQTLPPKDKSVRKTPLDFIKEAMNNSQEYTNTWEAAKEVVKEKYKDNEDALNLLDEYFNQFLDKPFSNNQLDRAVREAIKNSKINLDKIVREHYTVVDKTGKSLAEKLTREGLEEGSAEKLATFIQEEFARQSNMKKEQILSNAFKENPREKGKRKEFYQKVIELSNLGAFSNEKYKDAVAKKYNILRLSKEATEEIVRLSNEVQSQAKGTYEHDAAVARLLDFMDSQIPKSKWRYINAIQIMAMLTNTKTASRNYISNFLFSGVTNVKDTIRTGIDKGVGSLTGYRTSVLSSHKTRKEGYKEGANKRKLDFKNGINTKDIDDKLEMGRRKTFGNLKTDNKALKVTDKILGKIEDAMSFLMDDRPFMTATLKDSLRKQMILAEMNGEEFNEADAVKKANEEAAYETFNEKTWLSTALTGLQRKLNGGKEFGFGSILLRFAKTPANIFMRSIDYSPVSYFKAIYHAGKMATSDYADTKHFHQEKFVDDLAKAFTGTTLIGLGAFLAKAGAMILDRDKDKDKNAFDTQTGIGNFKINISAILRVMEHGTLEAGGLQKDDLLVSFDWAVPMATSLIFGGQLVAAKEPGEVKEVAKNLTYYLNNLRQYGEVIGSATNGMLNQPMLQNVAKLFSPYSTPTEALGDILLSVPQSFIPSTINQIKQLVDNQSRETYDKNAVKEAVNKAKTRVPGLSDNLPNKVDTIGQDMEVYQSDSIMRDNNLLNVMLNPAITTRYKPTPEEEVVMKIYEKTGSKIQFPRVVDKKMPLAGGSSLILDTDEYIQYQKLMGQGTKDILNKYIDDTLNTEHDNSYYEDIASEIETKMTDLNKGIKEEMLIGKMKNGTVNKTTEGISNAMKSIIEDNIKYNLGDSAKRIRKEADWINKSNLSNEEKNEKLERLLKESEKVGKGTPPKKKPEKPNPYNK